MDLKSGDFEGKIYLPSASRRDVRGVFNFLANGNFVGWEGDVEAGLGVPEKMNGGDVEGEVACEGVGRFKRQVRLGESVVLVSCPINFPGGRRSGVAEVITQGHMCLVEPVRDPRHRCEKLCSGGDVFGLQFQGKETVGLHSFGETEGETISSFADTGGCWITGLVGWSRLACSLGIGQVMTHGPG